TIVSRKTKEHFTFDTFDDVLNHKCAQSTFNDKQDYKWGVGQCEKSVEQCKNIDVDCYSGTGFTVQQKEQDGEGGCKAPTGCITSTCNPKSCDVISCKSGWCSKESVNNVAGICFDKCHTYNPCPENTAYKWKIVNGGKWKKYETKNNYNENDGDCVRKYKDGTEWKIEDDLKDRYERCSFNDITIGDDHPFLKKEGNEIVCSNDINKKWRIEDNLNGLEFNNILADSDGKQIHLDYNLDGSCSTPALNPEEYDAYCPEPVVIPDQYVEIDNGNCKTAQGKTLYYKNTDTSVKYIRNNSDYIESDSECHKRCDVLDTTDRSGTYVFRSSYAFRETDDCPDKDTSCADACKDDMRDGPYYKNFGNSCHCRNFFLLNASTSNCYTLPSYANYTSEEMCKLRGNLYEYSGTSCNTNNKVVCFDPLVDANNTPGFAKVEHSDNCYQLTDGPDDKYFNFYPEEMIEDSEGGPRRQLKSMKLDSYNTCAPVDETKVTLEVQQEAPEAPEVDVSGNLIQPERPSVEETDKNHDSITVRVKNLIYNDYPSSKSRILYKRSDYEHERDSVFNNLATTTRFTTKTPNSQNLERVGDENRGYIELDNNDTTEQVITIPSLDSNTQYEISVAIVYGPLFSQSKILSDSIKITTNNKLTPDTPSLQKIRKTYNSITVRVSDLKYNDYANDTTTKTLIIYARNRSRINAVSLTENINNNEDEGYIETTMSNTDITINNLKSSTTYYISAFTIFNDPPFNDPPQRSSLSTPFSEKTISRYPRYSSPTFTASVNPANHEITLSMNWGNTEGVFTQFGQFGSDITYQNSSFKVKYQQIYPNLGEEITIGLGASPHNTHTFSINLVGLLGSVGYFNMYIEQTYDGGYRRSEVQKVELL
ncbi:MAG: hypothetical protein O2827_06670, partial [Verrucomicrobia bacterium]|nr:hypothetical protein [Verrucomicrobiota bacterium]